MDAGFRWSVDSAGQVTEVQGHLGFGSDEDGREYMQSMLNRWVGYAAVFTVVVLLVETFLFGLRRRMRRGPSNQSAS